MTGHPGIAYKVLTAGQLAELVGTGVFSGAPADLADGYIHLSTAEQLAGTLDKHFAGQDDLAIAAINLAALGELLRWEPSRGGALFPHIYGDLLLDVVIAHGPLVRDQSGDVILPDAPL